MLMKHEKRIRRLLKKMKVPTEIKNKSGSISYPHNIIVGTVEDVIHEIKLNVIKSFGE